jgi:hypothetical protein
MNNSERRLAEPAGGQAASIARSVTAAPDPIQSSIETYGSGNEGRGFQSLGPKMRVKKPRSEALSG